MVAFGRPLYRAGMVSRWLVARALVEPAGVPAPRRRRGADAQVPRVGAARDPRVGPGPHQRHRARDAHRGHRPHRLRRGPRPHPPAPGRRAPRLPHLGVTRGDRGAAGAVPRVSTRPSPAGPASTRPGRYTGEVEFYSYGPFKAEAIAQAAAERGHRPGRLVRLLGLGHRPAHARGGGPSGGRQPRSRPGPGRRASASGRCCSSATASRCASASACRRAVRRRWASASWSCVGATAIGGVVAVAPPPLEHRRRTAARTDQRARHAPAAQRRRSRRLGSGPQASCSFFTAKAARATTTTRTKSFFMGASLGAVGRPCAAAAGPGEARAAPGKVIRTKAPPSGDVVAGLDPTALGSGQGGHDGQAQPGAARVAAPGRVGAHEALEGDRQHRRREARARRRPRSARPARPFAWTSTSHPGRRRGAGR